MDPRVVIWHNPACSKSRATLELLERLGYDPLVRNYLDDPPGADELQQVLDGGVTAEELVRPDEGAQAGLTGLAGAALLAGLAANPAALQRPVVLYDGQAALGRPRPDSVLVILPTAMGG